jgi:WD40 repeat protein
LITGSDDGTIRLWGPQVYDDITKSIILSPGEGYQAKSLDVGPGGRWLSISSADGHPSFSRSNAYDIPQLWDLDLINADPSREPFILHGHEDLVFATAFSSDGQWFATGGYDNTVRLWNLQDADPSVNPAVLHGHEAPITTLAFSPDGRWLITGSKDRTTRLWDLKLSNQTNFAAEPLVLRSHVGDVETVAFSPNTQWLAIGGESFNVQLNKTKQIFSIDEELFLYDHTDAVYDVAFGPDSNWLATGGADGTARLWDMQSITSSDAIRSITYTHEDSVYAVAFGPDGNWLATGTADNVVRLWNIKADKYDIKSLALRGHKDSVRALAFGPDGRWLASGSADDTVRLWDLKPTGPTEPMILDSHEETVYAVALSPNGHWLATGSADNTALLWDIKTLTNSYQETYYPTDDPLVLRNYEQEIKALAFSKPDGRWLATASGNIIRLWHLTGGKPSPTPLTLYGYGEQVESIAFSQEGHWLAAGSGGEVWIWHLGVDDLINLACRTAGRNFTLQEWQEYFPDQRYHATCADLPAPANTGN